MLFKRETVFRFEDFNKSTAEENQRLAYAVRKLTKENKPVCIQYGSGGKIKNDFLNLDYIVNNRGKNEKWLQQHWKRYFILPADIPLEVADNSVDLVFHEDFIEHIPQKMQFQVLAETFRMLKPGAVHRINTPCIKASMRKKSDFSKGMAGIYVGEWDRWSHVNVLTRRVLEEMAEIVGYSNIVFTAKNGSTSPFAPEESRPGNDRDWRYGNVFADLIK